jgi:uncharacterized Zn finger protein
MKKNLTNAITKARQAKSHVTRFAAGTYSVVTTEGHRYTVRFDFRDGARYGRCNCAAGVRSVPCKHLVKAAFVDSALTGYPMEA